MKKQWILVALAFAFAFASCTKTDPVGPNPVDPAVVNPETDTDTTPQPIQFWSNLTQPQTKAAIEAFEAAKTQELYIYAFAYNTGGSLSVESQSMKIENVQTFAPDLAATTTANLETNPTSAPVNVYNPNAQDINGNPLANTPFFYEENLDASTDVLYRFFGYYVGNSANNTTPGTYATDALTPAPTTAGYNPSSTWATPNPTLDDAAHTLTLPLTIDGTQDVMLATADPATDIVNQHIAKKQYANVSWDPNNKMDAARAYSAYSARRGLKPNLVFKHQLSRFVFYVIAGDEPGTKMMIESITLNSKTTGTLTIAANDPTTLGVSNTDNAADLTLKKANGNDLAGLIGTTPNLRWPLDSEISADATVEPLRPILPAATPIDYNDGNWRQVGESIIAMPGDTSYDMVLNMIQLKDNPAHNASNPAFIPMQRFANAGTISGFNNSTAPNLEAAKPGYQYNVYIVVYGPQEILVNVTLSEWTEENMSIIDPDKD